MKNEEGNGFLLFKLGLMGLAGAWLTLETLREMRVADEKHAARELRAEELAGEVR